MGDVSNTSTVNTETDKCKLWVFGAHIGFVLRPMKWSESHRLTETSQSGTNLKSPRQLFAQNAFVRQNQVFVA